MAGNAEAGFRTDIQGLRALAVIAVIAAHIATYQASGQGHILGGFIGVDVFFVLSGFLITQLLLRETVRTGRVSIAGFYARRARRILPAATVVLVAVVAYAAWRLPEIKRSQYSGDAGWSVTFLANWHFASAGVDYFDRSYLSPLQHFWSLAVEEQFYIVWPLMIGLLATRLRRSSLGAVVAALCLASLAWSVYVTSYAGVASTHEAYFSSLARAYELGIGALVAIVVPRLASTVARTVLGLAGLGAILGAIIWLPENAAFPGWQALIPCLGTAALLIAGDGGPTAVSRALSIAPMRFVGNISYSAYLWHFPIIVLARSLFPRHWSLTTLVLVEIVVIFALSTASYYLVETPWRSGALGNLIRRNRALVLWPLALTLVFGTITGGQAYADRQQAAQNSAAQRWFTEHHTPRDAPGLRGDPATQLKQELSWAISLATKGAPFTPDLDMKQITDPQPGRGYFCFAKDGRVRPPKPCVYGDTSASWAVALVGDSHAGMLIPFFDKLGKRDHFKVVMYQKLGCAPYDVAQRSGDLRRQCDQFRTWTFSRLRATKPDVIISVARGYLDVNPAAGESVAGLWRTGVTSTVRKFKSLGARVLLVGDVPARNRKPEACIQSHRQAKSCMIAPTSPESQSNVVTKSVAAAQKVNYLSMRQFACVGNACPLVVGSRILYWDLSHMTRAWIDHITPALEQKFKPFLERRPSS